MRLVPTTKMKGNFSTEPAQEEIAEQAVRRAVETALTEKQREAVELFFFEGLSQSEIARRLGVSQQVVQKRLHGANRGGVVVGGALARLREVLSPLVASGDRSP